MKSGSAVAVVALVLWGATEASAQWGPYGGRGGQQQQPAATPGSSLGIRYRLWQADLEGTIAADDAALTGHSIGLDSTLGMDDTERVNDISLWLPNLPLLGQLHVQYWWSDWTGSGTFGSDTNFAGTTFLAGTSVESRSEWKVYTFLWEYNTSGPQFGLAGLTGATGLTGQFGVKWITAKQSISGGGASERADLNAWIPIFGLVGTMNFGLFQLGIEMNGAKAFGISGVDGTTFDIALAAEVNISGLTLGIGYRWFKVDLTDESPKSADELDLDVKIEGLFFEGTIKF
jgi:hypothetical protein